MEEKITDLSIVLGAMVDVNKEMIASNEKSIRMLERQQNRQTVIILLSLVLVMSALFVVWQNTQRTFDAVEMLSQQVQCNTETIKHVHNTERNEGLHKVSQQE